MAVFLLNGCNGKFPGADARKFPDDPALRVKKILKKEEVLNLMINSVELKVVSLTLQVQMNCGELLLM